MSPGTLGKVWTYFGHHSSWGEGACLWDVREEQDLRLSPLQFTGCPTAVPVPKASGAGLEPRDFAGSRMTAVCGETSRLQLLWVQSSWRSAVFEIFLSRDKMFLQWPPSLARELARDS